MMGSPGNGGDNFTTLVSLLADPRQYADKLKTLEKSTKDANVAWQQAVDAIKKSEAAKVEADASTARLETTKADLARRESSLRDTSAAVTARATELTNAEAKLREDRRVHEEAKKAADDADRRNREIAAIKEADLNRRAANLESEIKRRHEEVDKQVAATRAQIAADRQAAAAAREDADRRNVEAEKLRTEHEARLAKLVALASGK